MGLPRTTGAPSTMTTRGSGSALSSRARIEPSRVEPRCRWVRVTQNVCRLVRVSVVADPCEAFIAASMSFMRDRESFQWRPCLSTQGRCAPYKTMRAAANAVLLTDVRLDRVGRRSGHSKRSGTRLAAAARDHHRRAAGDVHSRRCWWTSPPAGIASPTASPCAASPRRTPERGSGRRAASAATRGIHRMHNAAPSSFAVVSWPAPNQKTRGAPALVTLGSETSRVDWLRRGRSGHRHVAPAPRPST